MGVFMQSQDLAMPLCKDVAQSANHVSAFVLVNLDRAGYDRTNINIMSDELAVVCFVTRRVSKNNQ